MVKSLKIVISFALFISLPLISPQGKGPGFLGKFWNKVRGHSVSPVSAVSSDNPLRSATAAKRDKESGPGVKTSELPPHLRPKVSLPKPSPFRGREQSSSEPQKTSPPPSESKAKTPQVPPHLRGKKAPGPERSPVIINPLKDQYAVLGLPPTATKEEVTAKYRKLARENHPDKNLEDPEGASRIMQKINAARDAIVAATDKMASS